MASAERTQSLGEEDAFGITRLLTCLVPPAQDWDRYGDTMSALADVGHVADQTAGCVN